MTRPVLQVIAGGQPADSRAALRELYAKYGGTVYGRCQYLLGDRTKAEDAMQDVFAKALGHWHEFRNEASPLTWLIRIATHHCLNVMRAERAPWHKRFERETRARGEGHGGPQLFEDREAVRKLLGEAGPGDAAGGDSLLRRRDDAGRGRGGDRRARSRRCASGWSSIAALREGEAAGNWSDAESGNDEQRTHR